MDADTKALINRLNQIRLDENRSYADLATETGVDPGGLYKLLNGRSKQPYDRTLHKIRKYFERLDAKPPRKSKSRAA